MAKTIEDQGALRVDAERNRARIIEAAQEVFAERGIDAPILDVAQRAGVGVATLYRRFPNRSDLIAAAFSEQMAAFADGIEIALADPDPWHGFCGYIDRLCAIQTGDHGLRDALTMTFRATQFEAARRKVIKGFTQLITRAQQAGALRSDFSPEDLPMLLMANAGVIAATGQAAPRTSPRLIAYLLQAFAAPNAATLPPAPTQRQMHRALTRLENPAD